MDYVPTRIPAYSTLRINKKEKKKNFFKTFTQFVNPHNFINGIISESKMEGEECIEDGEKSTAKDLWDPVG